jgi:hypothetical protein
MSVPFSVTFNVAPGPVPVPNPGDPPQTIFVTSSTPASATFSQTYPFGLQYADTSGQSVTVNVTGTGRFRGTTYSGTITVGGKGGGSSNLQLVTTPPGNVTSNDVRFLHDVYIDGVLHYTPPVVIVYPPSAPIALSNAAVADGTAQWTVTYGPPAFTDGTNMTNTTALDKYQVLVQQTSDQSHTIVPGVRLPDNTSYFDAPSSMAEVTIIPESAFLVTVSANNVVNVNYGASNTFTFTTGILQPNPAYGFPMSLTNSDQPHLTSSFANLSGVPITDAPLVLGTTSTLTLQSTVAINATVGTRGDLFTSYSLDLGGGTPLTFNNLTTVPSHVTVGSQTLSVSGSILDQYGGTGYTGYYKYAGVQIVTDPLASSASKQNATMTDGAGGHSVQYQYYFDGTNGPPNCGSASMLVTRGSPFPTPVSICGVPCYHSGQSIPFELSVSGATNTGAHFQPLHQVTYSSSGGVTGTSQGTLLSDATSISCSVSGSSFSRVIAFGSTVFNTVASATGPSSTFNECLIDDLSYQQYSVTQSVRPCNQGLTSQRVVSPPTLTTFSALPKFDDTVTLDGTSDIQLAAGVYTSYDSTNAYLDYTASGGPDYTGLHLSGIPRYATFAWNFPTGFFPRQTISITVTGLPTPDIGSRSSPMLFGGRPLQVYYRYLDPVSPQPVSGGFNSVWINGNSKTLPFVSNQNYWDPTKSPYGFSEWVDNGGGSYTFRVSPLNSVFPPVDGSGLLCVMVGFTALSMTQIPPIGFSGVVLNSV